MKTILKAHMYACNKSRIKDMQDSMHLGVAVCGPPMDDKDDTAKH